VITINLLSRIMWECRICHKAKPVLEFTEHNRSPRTSMAGVHRFSRESVCLSCQSDLNVRKHRVIKERVIVGYGGKCMCPSCDVIERAFLTLDHVVPCGSDYRKEHGGQDGAWRDALQRNFPPDYQLNAARNIAGRAWVITPIVEPMFGSTSPDFSLGR